MSCDEMTLADVVEVVRGRQEAQWSHTSSLLAMIYNVNRGKGRAAKKPKEFNPYSQAAGGIKVDGSNITLLKALVPNAQNNNGVEARKADRGRPEG